MNRAALMPGPRARYLHRRGGGWVVTRSRLVQLAHHAPRSWDSVLTVAGLCALLGFVGAAATHPGWVAAAVLASAPMLLILMAWLVRASTVASFVVAPHPLPVRVNDDWREHDDPFAPYVALARSLSSGSGRTSHDVAAWCDLWPTVDAAHRDAARLRRRAPASSSERRAELARKEWETLVVALERLPPTR